MGWRCILVVVVAALVLSVAGCNDGRRAKARGVQKMRERDFGEAIRAFEDAVRADSADPEAYYYRGYAWMSLQDAQQALPDVERALQLKPEYAESRILRGYVRTELGQLDDAIADLNEAIRLLPDNELAYQSRGVAYAARGEFAKALADFDHSLSLNSQQAQVYNNRAWLRATARDAAIRDGKKAIEDATNASEMLPDDYGKAAIHDTLAAAHAEAGEFDKAVEVQQQAIAMADSRSSVSMKTRLELYRSKKPYRLPEGKFH